jgi:hypothetical protein
VPHSTCHRNIIMASQGHWRACVRACVICSYADLYDLALTDFRSSHLTRNAIPRIHNILRARRSPSLSHGRVHLVVVIILHDQRVPILWLERVHQTVHTSRLPIQATGITRPMELKLVAISFPASWLANAAHLYQRRRPVSEFSMTCGAPGDETTPNRHSHAPASLLCL